MAWLFNKAHLEAEQPEFMQFLRRRGAATNEKLWKNLPRVVVWGWMNGNKENASYTVWVATAQGELFYYNSSLYDESDASHRSRIQGINVEILNIRLRFPKIEDALCIIYFAFTGIRVLILGCRDRVRSAIGSDWRIKLSSDSEGPQMDQSNRFWDYSEVI